MDNDLKLVWLVIIADLNQKDNLINGLKKRGLTSFHTTFGKGTARKDIIVHKGLKVEPKKIIITTFVKQEESNDILDFLIKKFKFNSQNTGFAFTIPGDGYYL